MFLVCDNACTVLRWWTHGVGCFGMVEVLVLIVEV